MKLKVYSANSTKFERVALSGRYLGVLKLITFDSLNKEEVARLSKILSAEKIKVTLEPDEEIEELIEMSGYDSSSMGRHYEKINNCINKINELIREVNQLKSDKND